MTGVLCGQSLEVCGVIDNDLVAVLEKCAGLGSRRGIGSFGLDHEVYLLLKGIAGAGVCAPVAVLCKPLETVLVGAAGVVDIECTVLAVYRSYLPVLIYFVKRSTGILCTHGELLAVCISEAVGAVVVNAERPLVGISKSRELAVGELNICTLVEVTGVLCGHGLLGVGVKHNDGVAVLEGAQVGDYAAFTDGSGVELIKRKLGRVAAGVSLDRGIFVCTELVLRALVACKSNGIVALTGKAELAVGEANLPAVIARLDAVIIAALGSNGLSAAVFELDTVSADGDRPQQGRVDRNGVFICGDGCCR